MKLEDIILLVGGLIIIALTAWALYGDSPTLEGILLVSLIILAIETRVKMGENSCRIERLERQGKH